MPEPSGTLVAYVLELAGMRAERLARSRGRCEIISTGPGVVSQAAAGLGARSLLALLEPPCLSAEEAQGRGQVTHHLSAPVVERRPMIGLERLEE
jgi:hypothetical protein